MFTNPLQLTYNAVAKNLEKINQDGYSSEYYLDDAGNLLRFHAKIAHTIPKTGKVGESHLFRVDVEKLDSDGVLIRKDSVWLSARTDIGNQSTTDLQYLAEALVGILTTANITKLLTRQS